MTCFQGGPWLAPIESDPFCLIPQSESYEGENTKSPQAWNSTRVTWSNVLPPYATASLLVSLLILTWYEAYFV